MGIVRQHQWHVPRHLARSPRAVRGRRLCWLVRYGPPAKPVLSLYILYVCCIPNSQVISDIVYMYVGYLSACISMQMCFCSLYNIRDQHRQIVAFEVDLYEMVLYMYTLVRCALGRGPVKIWDVTWKKIFWLWNLIYPYRSLLVYDGYITYKTSCSVSTGLLEIKTNVFGIDICIYSRLYALWAIVYYGVPHHSFTRHVRSSGEPHPIRGKRPLWISEIRPDDGGVYSWRESDQSKVYSI